ncbi:MAG TPA: hypothetical protein VEW72_00365 [Burkholderiales bacterium]|nr:hypothetical protein [Burkholderiales bacterium]
MLALTLAWLMAASVPVLENDYVLITRDRAACPMAATPQCGTRVIVALAEFELDLGGMKRVLGRGDIAVVAADKSYTVPAGSSFFEVSVKPAHPAALAPVERIAPDKNALLYDSADFFVFAEKLEPGETRSRHSHSQRVVIQLNRTTLQQWPDGGPELLIETVPEHPTFSPPVVHKVVNAGTLPLYGIIVEFKPE